MGVNRAELFMQTGRSRRGQMAHKQVSAYPAPEQVERWEEEAAELGYDGVGSRFLIELVEAGLKNFDVSEDRDMRTGLLEQQVENLGERLSECREARERLERENDRLRGELVGTDRAAVENYVKQSPGATYDDISAYLRETTPRRLTTYLDSLLGEELREEDGQYYPVAPDVTEGDQ